MNGKEERKIKIFVKLVSLGLDPLVAYKICDLDLSLQDLMKEINYQMSLLPQ